MATKITPKLQTYIETQIYPQYAQNDPGHQLGHIQYVVRRSLAFAEQFDDIDLDMLYAAASFHDLAHHIDKDRHEVLSAELFQNDPFMQQFFGETKCQIIATAIADHRSTSQRPPRNDYGKIISSADRNTSVEACYLRSYAYTRRHSPELQGDAIIERCYKHLSKKFGKLGYAKVYVDDPEFDKFQIEIDEILHNRDEFYRQFKIANHLD